MKIINFSPHPWRGVEAMTLNGADCLSWHGRPGRKDSSSSFWACWTPPWPSKGGKYCCLMQGRPLTSTPWGRGLKASSSLRVRAVVKKKAYSLVLTKVCKKISNSGCCISAFFYIKNKAKWFAKQLASESLHSRYYSHPNKIFRALLSTQKTAI